MTEDAALRHAADYRVRFDEAGPGGILRGSALLGYVQDVAWRHAEALGFSRAWHRARGVVWLVRAVEARVLAPIRDGESITATTRLTGRRKVLARRETVVTGSPGDVRAIVAIDWAVTDGRVPIRIPAEFERAPVDGPGPFSPVRVDLPPAPPDGATVPFSPRPRELDPMGHANNGVYLDWLDEAVAAAGPSGREAITRFPRVYRLEYLRPVGLAAQLLSSAWPAGDGWAYRLAEAGADGADVLRGTLGASAGGPAAGRPAEVAARHDEDRLDSDLRLV